MRVLENVYEITNLHEAQSNVGWRISSQHHASAHVVLVQAELMFIGHSAWHFWVIRLLNSFKTKTEKSIEEQLYADTSCTSCSTSCSYEAKKSAEIASRTSPRTNSPCPGKWPSKCSPVPETIVSTLAIACSYCSPASASDVVLVTKVSTCFNHGFTKSPYSESDSLWSSYFLSRFVLHMLS